MIILLIALILAVLAWLGTRRARQSMANRFSERPVLEFNTFYQTYYAGKLKQELVEELLEHVAQKLSIPASKLLPSDRFDVELRPEQGWEFDSGKGVLLIELDRIARGRGVTLDIKAIVTLDDYLTAMAKVY